MNRDFLRRVAALCIPMALQNLINTGVMAADVFMIGRVGENVLSGASLAGQIFFILNLILFGVCSGASVLIAQYWGKQDLNTIEQVAGIAIRITVSTAVAFTIVTLAIPQMLMRIFTSDPEVIPIASSLLVIAGTFQYADGLQCIGAAMLRGIQDVRVPMRIALIAYIGIALPLGLVLTFPAGMGAEGMWLAFVIALAIPAVLFHVRFNRRMKKMSKYENDPM